MMFNLLKKLMGKNQPETILPNLPKRRSLREFIAASPRLPSFDELIAHSIQREVTEDIPSLKGVAMDNQGIFGPKSLWGAQNTVPNSLLSWFGNQTFIGNQTSSILAQHWLVYKACNLPARDAIRNGYEITTNEGVEISKEILNAMRKADVRYKIKKNMEEFITMGRVFGIRIALFLIDSDDPDFYEKPFNLDGVPPKSYRGITQIDPYWVTPELDMESGADPTSMFFYTPTWWRVNGKRYHHTHLMIFRNGFLSDILKPTYLYGGVSVPQKIYERVYCAERTANEAPQLAMTKRLMVHEVDLEAAIGNQALFDTKIQKAALYRDNYATQFVDTDEKITQLDTSLADLDDVIMSQYQIVAAIANVPATKLLGTTPKGFNSTGEHEETSYHEELESIQENDLTEFLERHHALLIRSEICPKFGVAPFETEIKWEPLSSVNAIEQAEINKLKAETGISLITSGAISSQDERERIVLDKKSGYSGLEVEKEEATGEGDPGEEITTPFEPGLQNDPDDRIFGQ